MTKLPQTSAMLPISPPAGSLSSAMERTLFDVQQNFIVRDASIAQIIEYLRQFTSEVATNTAAINRRLAALEAADSDIEDRVAALEAAVTSFYLPKRLVFHTFTDDSQAFSIGAQTDPLKVGSVVVGTDGFSSCSVTLPNAASVPDGHEIWVKIGDYFSNIQTIYVTADVDIVRGLLLGTSVPLPESYTVDPDNAMVFHRYAYLFRFSEAEQVWHAFADAFEVTAP